VTLFSSFKSHFI